MEDFDIGKIELLPISEPFREHIRYVATETGISEEITQCIADELSQRLHNHSLGLAPPIIKVPAWLKSLALTALTGTPIIGAGIEISKKRIKDKTIMQNKEAAEIEEKKSSMNRESEIAKVYQLLNSLPDETLEKFIDEVRQSKFIRKNIDSVIALLKERKLPESGLELAEVINIGIRRIQEGEKQ